MLKARTAAQSPPAPTHCAEHRQPQAPGGTGHTTGHTTPPSTDHARHPGCACGLCPCPCAQAPALVSVIPAPPLLTEHGPETLPYRAPDVSRPTTAFFRPPI